MFMKRILGRLILGRFGARLRNLREIQGFSQEGFAKECGLHRTAVGLIERGKRIPRLDTLLIISRHLKITAADLIRGIERWGPDKKDRGGGRHLLIVFALIEWVEWIGVVF